MLICLGILVWQKIIFKKDLINFHACATDSVLLINIGTMLQWNNLNRTTIYINFHEGGELICRFNLCKSYWDIQYNIHTVCTRSLGMHYHYVQTNKTFWTHSSAAFYSVYFFLEVNMDCRAAGHFKCHPIAAKKNITRANIQ